MKRFLFALTLPLLVVPLMSCTSTTNGKLTMGGVPKWIAEGAKIESEPKPYRPDPAIIAHPSESGPVEFGLITDRREYKQPPVKKAKKTTPVDPLERGRDYRIRRLFR